MKLLTSILSNALVFAAVAFGAIFLAPTAKAIEDEPPSGSLVDGFDIKNTSVIESAFDFAIDQFDNSSSVRDFDNCGWFCYVTKGISLTDYNGNQGTRTFNGYVVVTILLPANVDNRGWISSDYKYGVQDWGGYSATPNYASSQYRASIVISEITGSGSNQSVIPVFRVLSFMFDDNVLYPYNSSIKPTLFYSDWGRGIGGSYTGLFNVGGDIVSYGSVDSISNANLLAGLYDITFTPTVSFPADFPLIGKSLKVAPVAVRDDTGYNLISLQVPQLGAYADVIVFGEYHFVPKRASSTTYFNGLKFSFGSDPLNENDEEYDDTITSSMFSCVVDGSPLRSKIMTVNSLSFFYNSKLQSYSNRELTIFDYSSSDNPIYPAVRFMGIGSINGMSCGSFCYNCDFSGLVSPDSIKDIAQDGREETEDTITELGYVPVDIRYPDSSEGFDFDDPDAPDFSALGNIFSFMFNNRIIRAMLEMCLIVGLAGYVMYGKKGD